MSHHAGSRRREFGEHVDEEQRMRGRCSGDVLLGGGIIYRVLRHLKKHTPLLDVPGR